METFVFNACIDICKKLSKSYNESIYHEALCVLLKKAGISFSKEYIIPIMFENVQIGFLRSDIIIHSSTEDSKSYIIECKAIENELKDTHLLQIITYMHNTKIYNGMYINFLQNSTKDSLEFYEVTFDGVNYTFKNIIKNNYFSVDICGRRN